MNPKVSIIVPVYEVEDYIGKCIKSLLEQTYKDFEVLVVNDGTKDNSIKIANEIVKDDHRFIFLDKENGGLSDARNFGIKQAKGEYLSFLDSDDYFDKEFLTKMINKITSDKADIVICDVALVDEKYHLIREQKNIYSHPIEGKKAMFDISILNMAQNKLYKKKLFDEIQYPIGYYYEDRATTYKLFFKAKTISFLNESLFYYLQRNNSITRGLNQQKLDDPLKILAEIETFFKKHKIYDEYRYKFIQNYLLTILSSSVQIASFSDNYLLDIQKYIQRVDKDIYTIKNIYLLKDITKKKMLALLLLKFKSYKLFKLLSIREKQI